MILSRKTRCLTQYFTSCQDAMAVISNFQHPTGSRVSAASFSREHESSWEILGDSTSLRPLGSRGITPQLLFLSGTITCLHALPVRLIDVEARDSSDVRLYVVDQTDLGLRYLRLSHCRGSLDVITLEDGNLAELGERSHLNDLPKTFRDVVEITRSLGFRWLWIDALCIIQDSAADWKNEASRMAFIDPNSTCTIGTLFGPNSHAGCFKAR